MKPSSKRNEDKSVRITVDLSSSSYNRLEQLELKTGAASKAEVIRQALQLYEFVVNKIKTGAEFQLVEGDKTKSLVLLSAVDTGT